MRTKLFPFLSFLALALVLSACGPFASSQTSTLNVSGSGTVYLTPDIAYIYIGVNTEDSDIAQAVSLNNTQTQALVDALIAMDVAPEDIQTSNFSVWSSPRTDPLTYETLGYTYMVQNTVNVTLRDLSGLGELLNTAVSAGANNINSISFDVADKTAAMTQARQKAMDNASALAQELASTAGVRLGKIVNISYSESSPSMYWGMGGGGEASAPNASVPILPGQTQISVTVNVTYEIR